MVSNNRESMGPRNERAWATVAQAKQTAMLRTPNGFVAELCSRQAAPSRATKQRGPFALPPRPAQQLRRMYDPRMLSGVLLMVLVTVKLSM
jgi:hypothetical protein